jgi:aspartate kinase
LVTRALAALAGAGIGVVALQHQIRNVDVQFIVTAPDFEEAVRALHATLVEAGTATDRAAA